MATIHTIDALPKAIPGIVTIDELVPDLERMYDDGLTRGVHPGWDSLADYYRAQPGQCTFVTGLPSHGKSRIMSHMMLHIMQREGWKFVAFSPEATPARFTKQLIEQYTGKSFDLVPERWRHVQPAVERITKPELYEAQAWLHERFSLIVPPTIRCGHRTNEDVWWILT
jgi:replicative DNA helicase